MTALASPTMRAAFAICVLLLVAGLVGLVLNSRRERRDRLRQRINNVSRRAGTASAAVAVPLAKADPHAARTPRQRLAAVFGFDPARSSHYPVKWWVVIIATLLLARGVAFLSTAILGELSLLAMPPVWLLLSRNAFGMWDRKRRQLLLDMFPDVLSTIVRAVRVGLPVAEAIRIISIKSPPPISNEFGRVFGEVNMGVPMEEALRRMAERTGVAEYRFFATTLSLQAQTGGGLAETLENLADLIRKRIALRARGYALASEARTSTLVLTALPFVTAVALLVVSPDYISPMFTEPFGHKLLGIALLLLAFGTLVMRCIIRKALS